jgi:prepilin-type N-terminal cleavage/methylation domain-containing protein
MSLRGYSPRKFVTPIVLAGRRGFTLIEIMISLTVMTVGIMAAMSTIATMQGARQYTSEQSRLQAIANAVNERLLSMPFDDLAVTAKAPWTALGDTPITFAALEAANIIDKQLNARNSAALWDVKKNGEAPGVYIRFYRGVGRPTYNATTGVMDVDPATGYPKVDPNAPGLMDAGLTTWTLNAKARLNPNGVALLTSYLKDPRDDNASRRNPVIIHIRVVSGDGSIELFTARTHG